MPKPSIQFFKSLLILLLFLQSDAYAESTEQAIERNQLQTQLKQLQSQVQDTNNKIALLETALNSAHENIEILRSRTALDLNTKMQAETSKITQRTANGHGR